MGGPARGRRPVWPSMWAYCGELDQHEADAALSIWVNLGAHANTVAVLYLSRHGLQWRTSRMSAPEAIPDGDQAIQAFLGFLREVAAFTAPIPHLVEGPFVVERPDDLVGLRLSPAIAGELGKVRGEMGEVWALV